MLGPQFDEDNMILEDIDAYEAFCHFAAIGWKVLFALIPPCNIWDGKAQFIVALTFIGIVTAVVGEVATILGCVAGISESATAVTLVALGTSLPDTFASMTAAKTSEYADAAIGNVNGSNSVNVFLGLGLPWVIAAQYAYNKNGQDYKVPAGDVAFSVFVFLVVAIVCFLILIIRRVVSIPIFYFNHFQTIGGELGGPKTSKYLSTIILIVLWAIYIVMSILNSEGVIKIKDE